MARGSSSPHVRREHSRRGAPCGGDSDGSPRRETRPGSAERSRRARGRDVQVGFRAQQQRGQVAAFHVDKIRRRVRVTNTLRRAPILIDAHRTEKTCNEQMREIVDAGEFLADTKWGELDLLLLDLAPDTDRDPNRHCP
jgi:hypothetical protein